MVARPLLRDIHISGPGLGWLTSYLAQNLFTLRDPRLMKDAFRGSQTAPRRPDSQVLWALRQPDAASSCTQVTRALRVTSATTREIGETETSVTLYS